jgi:hypothetical protein
LTDTDLERDDAAMRATGLLPELGASVWLPDPVGLSSEALADDLRTIGTAGRVLSNRVAELEAEVARQHVVAERLRQRLAAEMDARVTAEQSLAHAGRGAPRATRSVRYGAAPRAIYRRLRTRW